MRAPSDSIRKEDLYVYFFVVVVMSVLGIFECAIWPCTVCKCVAAGDNLALYWATALAKEQKHWLRAK